MLKVIMTSTGKEIGFELVVVGLGVAKGVPVSSSSSSSNTDSLLLEFKFVAAMAGLAICSMNSRILGVNSRSLGNDDTVADRESIPFLVGNRSRQVTAGVSPLVPSAGKGEEPLLGGSIGSVRSLEVEGVMWREEGEGACEGVVWTEEARCFPTTLW